MLWNVYSQINYNILLLTDKYLHISLFRVVPVRGFCLHERNIIGLVRFPDERSTLIIR